MKTFEVEHEFAIGIIVPSYGHYGYVARCIESAFANSPEDTHVLVVDDGHPDYHDGFQRYIQPFLCDDRVSYRLHDTRYDTNGGFIRSINHGLEYFRDLGAKYTVCGNSDLVFAPNWHRALIHNLENGYDVVGPVTNAPGTEAQQWVGSYLLPMDTYRPSDEPYDLAKVANDCWELNGNTVIEGTINGFMMMGATKRFWQGAYDREHVFCPRNEMTISHGPNPTPLMTMHEYESQRRWTKLGWKIGYCPGSYVLHYRSVSRGDKYKRGQWLRAKEAP